MTAAGEELQSVLDVLMSWGATWAFGGPRAEEDDVSVCISDPGCEINVVVTADLSVFYQLWLGHISYCEASSEYGRNPNLYSRLSTLVLLETRCANCARRDAQTARAAVIGLPLPIFNNIGSYGNIHASHFGSWYYSAMISRIAESPRIPLR
jgi:hypothetical protein